jgi:hypothetical protein
VDPGVDVDELRAVLAAAAGPGDLDPDSLACEQLVADAVASATAGIWRFSHDGWSVVLKVLHHHAGNSPNWQSGQDEGHWYYWRREALAYSSGLLDHLPGSLRAPQCFGVFNRPDSSIGLWLEDLRPAIPTSSWSSDDYRSAAFALGHAQGAITASAHLAVEPWLARHWLRRFVERRRDYLVHLDNPQAWRIPLVSRYLPQALGQQMKGVFDERERLLAVVESAPQTLCHLDLHPGNLFAIDDQTVLIDWAFVGLGALGEDAGNLIFDSVLDFFVSPDCFVGLADAVSVGYLEGLEASGWHGDTNAVLRTMGAAAAVKFFWILPAMLDAATSGRDTLNGRPIEEGFAAWAPIVSRVAEFSRRV